MRKIAVVCLPGLESFLPDIVKFLQSNHTVRTCFSDNNEELKQVMEWADTIWIEWANELAVAITKSELVKGKHVICRVHSYEALSGFASAINWNMLDDVIFVADHVRDLISQQLAVDPKSVTKDFNTHIIPNGIDVDRYKLSHRKPGKNIAFLGNMSSKKGPMLLIHAFHELNRSESSLDNPYHLYIGGHIQEPRFGLYLSHMVNEMGLSEYVHFGDWIQDVAGWLEDKNYIVCTSPFESQGLGIMEAMCMGIKPVIHNFVGAKNIYDEKYLWTTISEFVDMIQEDEYNPLEYRSFISKNYLLRHRLKSIAEIINNPPEKKIEPPAATAGDYTEFEYWNRRAYPTDPSMSEETNQQHIEYIKEHVFNAKKVLDFGPGIGRTFSSYKGVEYVEGCDISRLYEKQAKAKAEEIGFEFKLIHLDLAQVGKLPYRKNQFDVAVASEILLHQRPQNILQIMRELTRVTKGVVIVVSWTEDRIAFDEPGKPKAGRNHCFHYNYVQICQEQGWKTSDIRYVDRQIYFCYEK